MHIELKQVFGMEVNFAVKISNQTKYGFYITYEDALHRAQTLSHKTGLPIIDSTKAA